MAIISRVDYENAGRVDAAPIMEGTKEKAPPLYLGAIACRTYQRERNRLGAAAPKGSHRLAVEMQVVLDRDALFDPARYLEDPRKTDRNSGGRWLPRYGLSAAEKRQPQQWLEKSVSRLCPGGGRDRGGDSEGAARSSRPLAKSPPPGLGSRRSEFPLSRVASCPTTVEAARRLPSGRSRCGQSLRASRPRPATRSSANGRAIGSSGHSCLWRSHEYSLV